MEGTYKVVDRIAGEILEGDFDTIHLEMQERMKEYGVEVVMLVTGDREYELRDKRYINGDYVDNFGDLIKYMKKHILEPATEELEADDLKISIYENQLSFQINELYDGLIYTYDKEEDKIVVETPLDRNQDMEEDEAIQCGKMVEFLKKNKRILKDILN